jgi:oligopeptide transport system permease protein
MIDGAPTKPPWRRAVARFARNRPAIAGSFVLAVIAIFCLIGPLLSPHAYDQVYPDYVKAPPSAFAHPTAEEAARSLDRIAARMRASVKNVVLDRDEARVTLEAAKPIDERLLAYFERSDSFCKAVTLDRQDDGRRLIVSAPVRRIAFFLGADGNGRDLLVRLLIAGRVSFLVGALASIVALVIGVAYGSVAGYAGGRIDLAMMRFVDILYALPFIFFVILLIVLFGRHFVLIFVAIGAVEWLDMARIVRGQTLSLKRRDYVLAAEALGVGSGAIVLRHIIPNLMGPVVAYLALLAPRAILLESFLSFLGLGVQEPLTSLGVLVSEGARSIQDAPSLLIFPAALLSILLFALSLLADGLRDAVDRGER